MKTSLTNIALGVSLLFNGAVLAGFAFAPPSDRNAPPREIRQRDRAPRQAGQLPGGGERGLRQGQGQGRGAQPGGGEFSPGPRGAGLGGPPDGGPFDLARAAKVLDLTDAQRGLFEELRDQHHELMNTFDQEAAVIHQLLDDELTKDDVSGDAIRDILERRADLGHERRQAQADLFARFIDTLTPEQRRSLRGSLFTVRGAGAGAGPLGPPEVVDRFDRDGNRRLDRDEARAARAALEARRDELRPRIRGGRDGLGPADGRGGPGAGRGQGPGPGPAGPVGNGPRAGGGPDRPHPPLWAFFDRDGNGDLDETERQARDEFVRTHPLSKAWRPSGPMQE